MEKYFLQNRLILLLCVANLGTIGDPIPPSNDKMEFVGGFVFPHGAITLNPETRDWVGTPALLPTSKEESIKLHNGMKEAAQKLMDAKPDLVIMSTPHGLTLQEEYLFIGNKKAEGSALWDGEWGDFKSTIHIDADLTKTLVKTLRDSGNPVELLALGYTNTQLAPDDPVNLRWGEVVPWWFVNEAALKAGIDPPKAIIFGQSRNRFDGTEERIGKLLKLGSNMSTFMKGEETLKGKRFAIVISSDLSHYHSKDPTSPYAANYTENSVVFDKFMNNWAGIDYSKNGDWNKLEENLLRSGGDLVDSIGSCGYTGLVVLHGFMKDYLSSEENENLHYKSHIHYYSAPTYYGMLSCSWTPIA